jgi:hypothetical protein
MALAAKPRYEKNNPYGGSHRAPLALDWPAADANKVWGVGLNSAGAIVKGAGQTGVIGLLIVPLGTTPEGQPLYPPDAGTPLDIMIHGEIGNFLTTSAAGVLAAGVAGQKYYAHADGSVDATATAGVLVGYTIEASRLAVHVEP